MAINIEIKAYVWDFAAIRARVEALSSAPEELVPQEDIFFCVPQGRLKLRCLSPRRAQLIYYRRPDERGPKRSDYQVFETDEPESLRNVLVLALGQRGVVRKKRYLYRYGQTRIHLDRVEGLGDFVELEVVLRPEQNETEGRAIAQDLMEKLGISSQDLIEGAYIDLLERRERS